MRALKQVSFYPVILSSYLYDHTEIHFHVASAGTEASFTCAARPALTLVIAVKGNGFGECGHMLLFTTVFHAKSLTRRSRQNDVFGIAR
jgi:hypothetical protein